MTHLDYHLYATLFDAAAATNQYIALSLFGEAAAAAVVEWARARDLPVRETARIAPNSVGDTQFTWRIVDVSDFACSCHITVQVQVGSEPITEAA